jgi:hypothetical protein
VFSVNVSDQRETSYFVVGSLLNQALWQVMKLASVLAFIRMNNPGRLHYP